MSVTLHGMKNLSDRVVKILRTDFSAIEPPRPSSMQRFEVGEQIVWALNRRNAERKAKLYPQKEIIGA